MDELEQLRANLLARKVRQNERRAKAGKPPMHPELLRASKKKRPVAAGKLPAPDSKNEEDTALSFDEWKEAGFGVKKGEKSGLTDINGVPQFLRAQVRRINPAWAQYRKRKS